MTERGRAMRSERKKLHSFFARLMVLMMIINLLSGINPSAVRADNATDSQHFGNNGQKSEGSGITLIETAKDYNNGEFDVEMLIKSSGNIITTQDKMDVVLVIDRSASMADNNRMQNTKKAAKGFVKALLKNKNVNVGLVSFAGRHRFTQGNGPMLDSLPITGDENSLLDTINGYEPYDGLFAWKRRGTFTQAGLNEANKLFKNNGNKRAIILITDGEPTYAYKTEADFRYRIDFDDVTDDSIIKYTHQVWSIGKDGQGNLDKNNRKLGKHYNTYTTGSWKNKKTWTYHPYYVELRTNYGKYIGSGDQLTDDIKVATLAEAGRLKKSGVDIYAIGIGVNETGKDVLGEIASQDGYYNSTISADDLDKILSKLKHVFKEYAIHNGTVKVKMNSQVTFESINNLVFKGKNNNEAATEEDKNELTERVKKIKKNWDAINKVLTLSNVTLGKDEELSIKYKAKLSENWMDGNFYQISETAEVLPKGNPNNSLSFTIPTVKDTKTVNVVVNKRWIGDKVPEGVNEVKFNITPEASAMNNTITVKGKDNWIGTLNDLPKYKDGKKIEYKVTEVAGNNYEIVENIEESIANNGDLVFKATNKNTEKVTFSVKKEWGTTPTDLQFPAKVRLYKNDAEAGIKAFSNNEVTFTDLDKYDASGNEIKYTVKEVNEEGTEEKDGKITNKGFDYTVSHTDEAYVSTITNTCTNPQAKEFTATITKKWKGGIGKEVTFLFNDKNGDNYGAIKLERKDNQGDTWTGNINLAKYNDEGKELTYVVTEKEIAGFTSDNQNGIEVSEEKPNATFINTRNTKSIKVTKTWKGTPDEYKINTVEVILSGKVNGTEVYSQKQNIELGADTTTFNNVPLTDENGADIEYSVKENGQDGDKVTLGDKNYIVSVEPDGNNGYKINNKYANLATDTIDVTLTKKWKDGVGNKAVFTFTQEGSPDFSRTVELPKDVKDGKLEGNVDGETWTVKVPLNKFNNNDEASIARYKVTEAADTAFTQTSDLSANDYIGEGGKKEVTFTNTRVMKELTLNKKWAGPEAGKAVFTIKPSNKEVELNASKNWHDTIALPVYELDGKVIDYTVTEEEVEGYKAKEKEQKFSFVDSTGQPGNRELTFINVKYTDTENSTFTIHKTWKSDFKQIVAFGLFDDLGNKIGHIITLTTDNALFGSDVIWSRYFITDPLPKYREDGSEIKYEIKEMDGLDDNAKPIENNKITIGNRTYAVERKIDGNIYNFTNKDITTGDVKATKIWEGTPSAEAKFGLFKKGTNDRIYVAPEVETKDNGRVVVMTFKDLPFADADGKAIEYEVREMNAAGDILNNGDVLTIGNKEYKVSYKEGNDGVIITNTELIKITVEKVWGENVPEIARQSVKFRITTDPKSDNVGKVYELNEANWTKKFENLPLYNNGEKINYSVVETEINGDKVDLTQNLVPDANGNTVYYHKAFKITLEGANDITESKTVKITNSIREAEPSTDPNNRIIHVVKDWTANAKKKNVTVKLYKLDTVKGEIVAVEGKVAELTEADKWTAKFEVPKVENNEEIIYYAFETAIGDDSIDESKLSPNLYNDGYQIGEYNVTITELTSDTQDAEFGDYGFYILNESNNNPVQPEEKVTINVTKKWAIPEASEYVKPVKVRLFVENGDYLVPVFGVDDLTLNTGNNWTGKFENLDKNDYDGNEINYHVAEVGIEGEQDKEIISLSDVRNANGYTIGKYHVVIGGDGTNEVVITNDVKLIDVKAVKNWSGIVPRRAVQFTLYSSHDNTFDSTGKVITIDGTGDNWVATFNNLPALDSNGKPIVYYVFETRIGDAVSTFTALAEATTSYSVNVTGGRYDVAITDNGTVGDKDVIIQNSYVPNSSDPVVPPIPGFDPTPSPTPDTTPTVDVTEDTTPQGDASTDKANTDADNTDDDGIVEIDEDDTSEDGVDVEDDGTPQGPVDVEEDETPQGNTGLPKTGGTNATIFGVIGLGLIGLGLLFKKRR